jgi:hypothetical protein
MMITGCSDRTGIEVRNNLDMAPDSHTDPVPPEPMSAWMENIDTISYFPKIPGILR